MPPYKKYFSRQFKVFYRHTQIAAHKRDRCEFHYTTDNDHMASQHKFRTEWTPERFLQRYPDEARYISKILEQKAYPEQAYKSCSGFRALPGESVRNGLRKPAVGQYNSRDRRDI